MTVAGRSLSVQMSQHKIKIYSISFFCALCILFICRLIDGPSGEMCLSTMSMQNKAEHPFALACWKVCLIHRKAFAVDM